MSERKKVGLALGGGVARGLTHIGVLKSLLAAGIPIDLVAGTSAGSIVGSAYCAGVDLGVIEEQAAKLHWWTIARLTWPNRGLFSFRKLEDWLIRMAGADLEFHELKLPFAVAATDVESGETVHICSGRVAPAVHASCSVPGFVAPVRLCGRLLGDGSLVDTVPVNILRKMGADYVIGVDIFRPRIRKWMGALGYGLNALEITFMRAGSGFNTADCLISPELSGETYVNFGKAQRLIELGRQAAEKKIPEIRVALEG